jgi:hypothetical protein
VFLWNGIWMIPHWTQTTTVEQLTTVTFVEFVTFTLQLPCGAGWGAGLGAGL